MVQPANPTVRHGSNHDVSLLSLAQESCAQASPAFGAKRQTLGRFDDHRAQLRIAGFDQPGVRLTLSARGIARTQAAASSQLLAALKAIEAADLSPYSGGGHRSDAGRRAELFDDRFASHQLLKASFHFSDAL